jgi:mannose-6-phosphate isomerase-like protein (cupin superfamily)
MALLAENSWRAAGGAGEAGAGSEFSFPYRRFEAPEDGGARAARRLGFTVTLTPGPGPAALRPAAAGLHAAAAFLVDAAYDAVPAATLARMIGRYFFASGCSGAADIVTVLLASTRGGRATALATVLVERPEFEVEHTAFGAAHIVHEDDTLGLYILEIAPRGAIPAHCHRVMRESELILDDGLLQQGRPVAPGNAFAWPLGHVHAYRNPTGRPRRILCLDSPRFMPEDEVPLAAVPPLVPLAPLVNYLA